MTQGRASTPEAEEWRREQIRFAVKQRAKARDSKGRFISTKDFLERSRKERGLTMREGKILVRIKGYWRVPNPHYPQIIDIDYFEVSEKIYIDPAIANNDSALNAVLNERRSNRVYFMSRVAEYL